MAAPVPAADDKGTGTGSGTNYVVDLSNLGTLAEGSVIVGVLTPLGSIGSFTPPGFVRVLEAVGADVIWWCYAEDVSGSSITFTGDASNQDFGWMVMRAGGACHVTINATEASGTGTNPNPPSHAHGMLLGAFDGLWLTYGFHNSASPPTNVPANYTLIDSLEVVGWSHAWAYRQLNATSGNPGTWTWAASAWWTMWTLVVWPNDRPIPRAVGTVASGTGAITPGLPTGTVEGDGIVMETECDGAQTVSLSGWTQDPSSPQSADTGSATDTKLQVWRTIQTSGGVNRTTNDPGDHVGGRIISIIRGSFDPDTFLTNDEGDGGSETTSDTSGSIPGGATSVDGSFVLVCIGHGEDGFTTAALSSWTNGDLAQLTELIDNRYTAGNGGGLGMAAGYDTTAGSYGATTVTLATASLKGLISLVIKPPPTGTSLEPSSLVHTRGQGIPTVSPSLVPTSLVHTRALGTPAVSPTLQPASLVHTRALGVPSVSVVTVLQPASLVHTRALGTPVVNPTLSPASLVHARALGTPTLTVSLAPASLVHARALGTPSVSTAVTLEPASLVHVRAIGSPSVSPAVLVVPDASGPRRRRVGRRRVG